MPPRTRRAVSRPADVVDLTDQPQDTASTTRAATNSRKRKRQVIDVEEVAEVEIVEEEEQETEEAEAPKARPDVETIGKMSCVICMDNFTDATAASCGHVFCHQCLTRALMASEKHHERGAGACPTCRKALYRSRQHNLIPLNFMQKKTYDKMKGKQ